MNYLVQLLIAEDFLFDLAHYWENVGGTVVITVSSNTEIDLIGIRIVAISNGSAQNGIRWSHLHMTKQILVSCDVLFLKAQCQLPQTFHQ